MGGRTRTRSGRRYRRARRLRSEKRGVVAVIGTLLALLVFFALFGIFLTQYVPLWMTDNEAAFTNSAAGAFAQLKSGIDTQYALGLPPTLGTPFVDSSAGVPLIANPTEGSLSFIPQTCPSGFYYKGGSGASSANWGQPVNPAFCVFENQTMSTGPGGSRTFGLSAASGVLQMFLPNRYFSPTTFLFEDDGVIQSQSYNYQIMAFSPPFNVTRLAGNVTVASSFLQLYGNASTVIGTGTEEVYSHLRYTQELTSNGRAVSRTNSTLRPFNYTFEVGTVYPCAWQHFLWGMMNATGLARVNSPTWTTGATPSYNWSNPNGWTTQTVPYTGGCTNSVGTTTVIALNLFQVNYAILYYAGVQLNLGIGGI